jgi:ADP-heptose:LPS heptosyltransferase
MEGLRSVTAVLLGRLGDAITATAWLDAVKRRHPEARVTLALSAACRGLDALIDSVDRFVWVHPWTRLSANVPAWAALRRRCDLLVDLNPAPSKSAAALIALASASEKLGFRKKRLNGVFTRQIDEPAEDEPMLERYRRLAAAVDARDYRPMPRLARRADKPRAAAVLERLALSGPGLRLAIHPGNFKKFDNRWPEEKFVALADRLAQDPGLRYCWLAGPGEQDAVSAISRATKRAAPVYSPASLAETSGFLQNLDAFVCNVTGTTHLAHALGVPTFALYSGYTNAVWRPADARCGGVVSAEWESCRSIPLQTAADGLFSFLTAQGKK